MLTMHAAADACRPHLSWGYSLGWGRQKSRTTHACSCSRSMCVDSGRVGRCSLPLARSLPTRWTRLGPCGPPTAEEQQLVTSIASVLTPYVPCRRARLCRVYCLSLGVSQSVSQSVACNRNRAYYCHTLNEPAGHRRAARRPIPTDGWFYVTIRYDMNTLFFVLFWKNVVLFLVWKRDFWSLGMHRAIFFSSPPFGFPFLLRSSVQQSLWASIIHIYPELIWNDPTWSRCST
jgi:hypothetical protein